MKSPSSHRNSDGKHIVEVDFALRYKDPVAIRRLSESSAVFEDDQNDIIPMLSQDCESPVPSADSAMTPEALSTTSSDVFRSSTPPQRVEMEYDIPVWGSDEQPAIPAAPRIRDDMELGSDIPVWEPDDEPVEETKSNARQEPTNATSHAPRQVHVIRHVRASRKYVKTLLKKSNARKIMFAASRPAPASVPAGSGDGRMPMSTLTSALPPPIAMKLRLEGGISALISRKGKRRAKKEKGHD